MTEYTDETAKAIANDLSKEGTFNFLERLAGRGMPTDEVVIYLDERAAHKIQKLEQDQYKASDKDQIALIEKQIQALQEQVAASRYVLHLTGISVEEYDALIDGAQEQFPVEYKESRHPLTMALERTPIQNDDREVFLRTHLWAKSITKVVGPEGGEDTNITPEWAAFFLNHAPLTALGRVQLAIEGLRMATDWMDRVQSDDFLVKS